jgi:hypothetical protein
MLYISSFLYASMQDRGLYCELGKLMAAVQEGGLYCPLTEADLLDTRPLSTQKECASASGKALMGAHPLDLSSYGRMQWLGVSETLDQSQSCTGQYFAGDLRSCCNLNIY